MRFAKPAAIAIGLVSIPLYFYIATLILGYIFRGTGDTLAWIIIFGGGVIIFPCMFLFVTLCALATYALCFQLLGTSIERANRYSGSMKRTALAFLVSPLWVPASTLLIAITTLHTGQPDLRFIFISMMMGAVLGYSGMVAFGLPAFLILRARSLTALWIAALTGFAAGSLSGAGFLFLMQFLVPRGMSHSPAWNLILSTGLVEGIVGSVVGATFWLIARPDRLRSARAEPQTDAQPADISL